MDVINAIRRKYGLDISPGNEDSAEAITFLRDGLERACLSMSKDLYSEVTHFVLELVQNADDNMYPEGTTPKLVLELIGPVLSIRCNETGFNDDDVRAICAIRRSTKKDPSRYIGAKGIGFKSVFTVAETVSILSGRFSFMLDRNQTLGMISPIWIDDRHTEEGWSNIELELSLDTKQESIIYYLDSLHPSILLFLRKLHSIEIRKYGEMQQLEKTVLEDGTTRLSQSSNLHPTIYSDYIVFEHAVQTYRNEKDRQGIVTSDMIFAFPLTSTGEPLECDQNVYAFLPVRSFGFQFIIQADFLTTTNREDIIQAKEWNRTLCGAIPSAFMLAIPKLQVRPALTYTWIRFLKQRNYANIFRKAFGELLFQIRKTPVLLSREMELCRPMDLLILPPEFKASSGEPIISHEHLLGKYYLAAGYDATRDVTLLTEMGVAQMTINDFMTGLMTMQADGSLYSQSDDWWHTACRILLSHFAALWQRLRSMRIVPLTDGSWVSADGGDLIFDSTMEDVPQDLDFKLAKPLDPRSNHHRLLQDLGIKDVNPLNVMTKIMTLHHLHPDQLSPAALPSHAHYLFRNRTMLANYDPLGLRVLTRNNEIVYASEAYMDHHSFMSPSLSSCLSADHCPFLHPSYVQMQSAYPTEFKAWENWLRDELYVNTYPKLNEHGLSQEFRQFILSGDTKKLLMLMRQFAEGFMSRLRDHPLAFHNMCLAPVATTLGVEQPLKSTYIAREDLTAAEFEHLPFLPIDDPESLSWNFLAEFGVSFKIDSSHYLKELVRLSEQPLEQPVPLEEDRIFRRAKECYKQLETRLRREDQIESVLVAFHEHPLVYLPQHDQGHRWLKLGSEVFWDGPPSIHSKPVLKTTYKDLGVFFSQQLRLPNTPPNILLDELKSICELYPTGVLDEPAHIHIHDVLKDIGDALITSEDAICDWLPVLTTFPCIPVETKYGPIQLRGLGEGLYLPDAAGDIAGVFRGDIPIVTKPPPGSTNSLASLYKLFNFEPFIVVQHIEVAVQQTLSCAERHPLKSLTDKYHDRRPYLYHLLDTEADSEVRSHIWEFLRVLENALVYAVPGDSVEHVYTLDGVVRKQTRPVGIEKDRDSITVLVASLCPPGKWDLYVCKELSLTFPAARIPVDALLTAFTLSTDILDELHGPPGDRVFDEPDTRQYATPSIGYATSPPRESLSPPLQTSNILPIMRVFSSSEQNSTNSGYLRFAPSTASGSLSHSQGYQDSPSVNLTHQPTPEQRLAGYEGEKLIYQFLQERIPGFSWRNWSSDLRTEMGLPPLLAPSVTDFFYQDVDGILTRHFFGDWFWAAWRHRPPTYWIEVKATTGASDEPFHFSAQQLSTALNMSKFNPEVGGAPPNIYVLARVSRVQNALMNPCIYWYPNPWQLFCNGSMVHASDVALQIPASIPGIILP